MASGNRKARARPRWGQRDNGRKADCPVTGKRSWHSEDAALIAAAKLRGYSRIYLCGHCGCWHITSKRRRPHR